MEWQTALFNVHIGVYTYVNLSHLQQALHLHWTRYPSSPLPLLLPPAASHLQHPCRRLQKVTALLFYFSWTTRSHPPNSAQLPGENDASSGEAEPSLCGRDVDNVFSTINHNQENLLYVYAHSFPYSTVIRYRKWHLLPAHTFTQLDTAPHTHPSHFLRPLLGHICRRSSWEAFLWRGNTVFNG